MDTQFFSRLHADLEQLRVQGLYKNERAFTSPQEARITVQQKPMLNFCANNYLGLSNHAVLKQAAHQALDAYGFGLSSVRFICGTQTIHQDLEREVSQFLGMDDTILYSSCFDANGGLFETLLSEEDAIISDALNHASIIDGIRLSKAARYRYANNDMTDLEKQLQAASHARTKLIATDGVFSMDGSIANLKAICDLADRYGALVMVDDSHAVGFMGKNGRGTPEYCGVEQRIDILTGTFGKALGGASGGYTSARAPIVEWLRQRSRPYLFSNSLAPVIVQTTRAALQLLASSSHLRDQLHANSAYFRKHMTQLGFHVLPGEHAIIPIMLGDAALATRFADAMLQEGVYVIGFSYPVVPKGQARIRTQMSAAHTQSDVQAAVAAFEKVGKQFGIIST